MTSSPDVPLEATVVAAKALARARAREARAAAKAAGPGAPRLAAANALAAAGPLKGLGRVAGYMAIGSELDPGPLMLALHGLGVPLCMPTVIAPATPLVFRPWVPGSATVRSAFGVDEPAGEAMVAPDFVLVPLLAFDRRGHRLGYGGGHYDRTLAGLRAEGRVRAVGYAYAAQEVPEVPSSEFDAPLEAIVTERGVVRPE